ncbi:MAG: hypothetical protein JOY90_00555 [Bradyrhizobium sp.]|uniref:hypothetical protein n=1 Tax=Bradyrhizobium sp. TaxID=376 RepID=UPI001DC03D89|nr:hypothetical protein [Bradyrhizobium sp.]MBV9558946.1 hypothetical protein [Bradyrhizobium sp.]
MSSHFFLSAFALALPDEGHHIVRSQYRKGTRRRRGCATPNLQPPRSIAIDGSLSLDCCRLSALHQSAALGQFQPHSAQQCLTYSITSSAPANMDCGIELLSTLAALRLITRTPYPTGGLRLGQALLRHEIGRVG